MVHDPRILLLIAGVFVLALATMLHLPAPGWLLLVTAAGLILAGALAARSAPAVGPGGTSAASGGDARLRDGTSCGRARWVHARRASGRRGQHCPHGRPGRSGRPYRN